MPPTVAQAALTDLRVVELCRDTAGAYGAKLLADLGAYVIKVVDPVASTDTEQPTGDAATLLAARTAYLNTSKHLLTVEPGAHARVGELANEADVVIEDLADVEWRRYGLSAADDQVWCTIRPFGSSGPYAHYRGTHLTIFHAGVEARLLRTPTDEEIPSARPIQAGSELGEYDTGVNAAIAVLAAVRSLRLSGAGQRIDVSGQESQLTLNRTTLSRFVNDGVVMQAGPRRRFVGGLMASRDGFVGISGLSQRQWQALAATPEGACFSPFLEADGQVREELVADLRQSLAEWCSTRTKDTIIRSLRAAGCAVAEFADADDLISSAQMKHRQFLRTIEFGEQSLTIPGPSFHLSLTPANPQPAVAVSSAEVFPPRTGEWTGRRASPSEDLWMAFGCSISAGWPRGRMRRCCWASSAPRW
jgi:crotonobetainyl-CoA:carnitine CoA-transferase CaiB-like acyl-CoA transferase